MKFLSKTDFHGMYCNVGGFTGKKNETFIQANIVSNMPKQKLHNRPFPLTSKYVRNP